MTRLVRFLYRSYLRAGRKFPPTGLLLQITPQPAYEMQRFVHFESQEMHNAVLQTLTSEWPSALRDTKAKNYVNLKGRIMQQSDFSALVRESFRRGDSTCIDFGLSELKTLSELLTLAEQTSIKVTDGVKVSCTTMYSPQVNAESGRGTQSVGNVYYYRIVIENTSDSTVQLLGRHWRFSANGFDDFVVDKFQPGVIGEQPVLAPGQGFSYMSSTSIHNSKGGTMSGAFEFLRCGKDEKFEVEVGVTRLLPRSFS